MNLRSVANPIALGAMFLGLGCIGGATEPAAIDLPKYTVTADRGLPPPESWHYVKIEGFEILSSASTTLTHYLARDLQDFTYALDIVWPGVRRDFGLPILVVVCGRFGEFSRFQSETQVDVGFKERFLTTRSAAQAAILLDQTIVLAPGEVLHRNYINVLLSGLGRKPPPWLTEGLSRLVTAVHITENSITMGKVVDPQGLNQTGGDFNLALGGGPLLPMAEVFSRVASNAVIPGSSEEQWAVQCFAFVHWGLYGENGRNQEAFLKFILHLQREPLTETLFKDCFGRNYSDMLYTLRSYVEFTRHKIAGMKVEKGRKIPFPAPPVVRDATQAEIGRITGDTLVLTGRMAAAREAYVTAYQRGERDPTLLAALGQAELAAGDDGRARKFLEAASAGRLERPQAHVELGRLRLAAARAQPEAASGKLSSRQLATVLEPLFTARDQPPALPETYELIAAAWNASVSSPTPAQLAVLDEGVRFFPKNAALVYADAELQAKAGQIAIAESLIRHGMRVTVDATLLAKFENLRTGLPVVPTAPPKS